MVQRPPEASLLFPGHSLPTQSKICVRLAVTSFVTGGGGSFGEEGGIEGLFEGDVLDEGLGDNELLNNLTLLVDCLTDNDTFALGLEQNTTGRDGLGTTIVLGGSTDGTESHLEDTNAIELYLLAQFEEVLQSTTKLVEYGLDV